MYTMIIVDNDEKSKENIERTVKESFKEITIINSTYSGFKAIALMEEYQPDILVITASLPGISGLDVVRHVRKENHHMRIIIDSIYDCFEFANEAMELEATSYLLKPITSVKLVMALKKVIEQLKTEEAYKNALREKDSYIKNTRELLDYSFIYTFLFNYNHGQAVSPYIGVIKFPQKGYIMNIELLTRNPERISILKKGDSLLNQTIRETISPYGICIIGPRISKRIIVLIGNEEKDPQKVRPDQDTNFSPQNIAKKLIKTLAESFNIEVSIGIGNEVKLENIHDSYEESIRSLWFLKEKKIVHAEEIKNKYIEYDNYYSIEEKLIDSIKVGKEESLDLFIKILESFRKLKPESRKNKVIELLTLSCYASRLQGQNESEYTDYMNYYRQIQEMNIEKIEEWTYSKFEYMMKAVRTSRSGRKSGTIQDALHYITDNWSEKLSLEEVSQYVGLTPQHFSKVFKQETNYNYIDYLTKIRMDVAKKYLMEGDRTIKEICYLVGYHDPNYFSRLFKRMEGISPTKYKSLD